MEQFIQITDKTIDSITFKLEDLEPPKQLIEEKNMQSVIRIFSSKVEKAYQSNYSLACTGSHSFIYSMYRAYAEHRPFIISPDMIWLLICQGFSNHVNFNRGTAQDVFPNLGKHTLEVQNDEIILGDPNSPWEKAPAEFVEQMSEYIDADLLNALRADFSTTTSTTRIATEITIMDAMKSYFEYRVIMIICGIPAITIEGSEEDWEKMLKKLDHLNKYGLEWWTEKLKPILNEFVNVSKGLIDKTFWMNMFKVHTKDSYGSPKSIDGWILKFYPYDRTGEKVDIREIQEIKIEDIFKKLPKEIVSVDFEYQVKGGEGNIINKKAMEYWAGFVGARQNQGNFAIRPEIGWFVTHKEDNETPHNTGRPQTIEYFSLASVPKGLYHGEYNRITLNFIGEINIPGNLTDISAKVIDIKGHMTDTEKSKLKNMFAKSETGITVNGEVIRDKNINFKSLY